MKKIPAIAWKDVRSTVRNVPALVMMLVAPLALAALLGFAFGGGASFEIAATKVAVANGDTGSPGSPTAAGCMVAGLLESPDLSDVLRVRRVADAAAARKAVDDGDVAVAVVIPAELQPGRLRGRPGRDVRGGSSTRTRPVRSAAPSWRASSARCSPTSTAPGGPPPAPSPSGRTAPVTRPQPGWPLRRGDVQAAAAHGVRPADHATRAPRVGKTENEVSVTRAVLAGMMVFFMFFGAANVARTILTEDRDGTLPRLFTTPTRHGTIIAGKFVSVFLTVLLQAVVLLIAGRLIFGIHWGRIDAVALLTLAAAGVAGGLALLIISFTRNAAQAGAVGSGIYLVLALLGGNFTGTAQTSGVFAVVQRLTPNGWLIRGWDATLRGGGAGDIRWQLLVTLGFAAAFFVLAVLRMRRRFA